MSKITRKSYKRKKILMGVSLFGAVGLVSTGFAAWVLSTSTTVSTDPEIHVGTVSDKGMQFENVKTYLASNSETLEDTFQFEPRQDDAGGRVRPGLGEGESEVKYERLSLYLKGELTNANFLGEMTARLSSTLGGTVYADSQGKVGHLVNDVYTAYTSTDDDVTAYTGLAGAIALHYVAAPSFYAASPETMYKKSGDSAVNKINFTLDSSTNKATFGFGVAFAWGTAFNQTNPADYYDVDATGSAVADAEVKATLTALHTLLNGSKLELTLVAIPD